MRFVRAALLGYSARLISGERRVLAYLTVAASSRSFNAASVSTCLIHVSKFWHPLYIGGRGALMLIPRLLLGRLIETDDGSGDSGGGGDPKGVPGRIGDPTNESKGENGPG